MAKTSVERQREYIARKRAARELTRGSKKVAKTSVERHRDYMARKRAGKVEGKVVISESQLDSRTSRDVQNRSLLITNKKGPADESSSIVNAAQNNNNSFEMNDPMACNNKSESSNNNSPLFDDTSWLHSDDDQQIINDCVFKSITDTDNDDGVGDMAFDSRSSHFNANDHWTRNNGGEHSKLLDNNKLLLNEMRDLKSSIHVMQLATVNLERKMDMILNLLSAQKIHVIKYP